MTRPFAYVRKSTQGTAESMSDQIVNVRKIVERNGRPQDAANLVLLTADWGVSASREKRAKRLDMTRLIEAIRAGEVSHLYAYSHDRLARDVETSAALLNAMADAGIECTTGERTFRPRDPMDRQQWHFTAMQGEAYVEQAQRKAQDRVANQRRRGVVLGQKSYGALPGEDAGAVVAAFTEAGSYLGAARMLAERGIKSRRSHLPNSRDGGGGMQGWSASTIKRIVSREAPGLIPVGNRVRGARTRGAHLFSRLLICPHDGSVMTTMPRKDASTAYLCREGHRAARGTHPRPWVIAETRIREWAMRALAAQFEVRKTVEKDDGTEASITAIEEDRRRLGVLYQTKALSDDEYLAGIARVDAELVRLQASERASVTWRLGLDWTLPEAEVNSRLRDLWSGIRLAYVPMDGPRNHVHTRDLDLVPVEPIWRTVPEAFDPAAEAELRDPEAAGLTIEPY
jgi:DNA invertase Pin-like site-specific DNA recombinase